MSDMTTAGIIERLEAASGPDRWLDAMICQALRIAPDYDQTTFVRPDLAVFDAFDNGQITVSFANHLVHGRSAPPYTSSIDAALSLVPEGWRWKLGYSKHVPCVAELVDYTPKAIGATCGECDSNHAIALCIAALKARSHPNKGEG